MSQLAPGLQFAYTCFSQSYAGAEEEKWSPSKKIKEKNLCENTIVFQ